MATQHLEGADELDRGGTESAVFLGDEQSGDADFGDPLPQVLAGLGVALGPGAVGGHRIGGG